MSKSLMRVGILLFECITYSNNTAVVRQLNTKTGVPEQILTVQNPQRLRPDQILVATTGMVGIAYPFAISVSLN